MNEESLFAAAIELPPGTERDAFIHRSCADDVALRERLVRLLAAHDRSVGLLESKPFGTPADPQVGARYAIENVTNMFGPASLSVLTALGEAFGGISTVLLRDTDAACGSDPITRPSSREIPNASYRSARLQLFGEIARGGMGAILKGHDSDLGRDLAVKILLESHRDKPEMIRRFIEEAQIAGQLQHPGIVPIYELGAFGDRRPYFAMKLVKGQTLAEILATRTSPADGLPRLLAIFESICQTLAYAHARGVIHRDLKPSNVMVGAFGEVQVMDWGLAKVLPRGGAIADASAGHTKDQETVIATARSGTGSDLSQAGSIMGTPSYMAPEQARGELVRVDERADVFALGSMFCEILSGQPAFSGRNSGEILRKAARGEVAEAVTRLANDALGHDQELIALAKSCLAAERDDRPSNAGEIAEQMARYRSSVQQRLTNAELERARAEAKAAEEHKRRRLSLALAASVIGLLVLGTGGWLYFSRAKAARLAATDRAVNEALDKATLLRGQAKAASVRELSKWGEALAAANEANASLEAGEPTDPLRARVAQLRRSLEQEQAEASRLAAVQDQDRRLFEKLDAIRFQSPNREDASIDAAYAKAFREFGIDVDKVNPQEAAIFFRNRSNPQEFAFRLDDWSLIRKPIWIRDESRGDTPWRRLILIAQSIDEDSWRNSVRSLIGRADLPAAQHLAADEKQLAKQPARSLYLLARVLQGTRQDVGITFSDLRKSTELLNRAWRLSPNDYAICRTLSSQSERDYDRIRFATAAVAASPNSAFARLELAEALLPPGALDLGPRQYASQSTIDKGNGNVAIAELRLLTQADPKSIEHLRRLALALALQGRFDEAMKESELVAAIDPKLKQGPELGRLLYVVGQPDRALQVVQQDIARDPHGLYDSELIGRIYQKQGKNQQAFAVFREEFLRSESTEFLDSVCKGMESTGKPKEVVASYRAAIKAHPNNLDLPDRLAKLFEREGKTQEALVVYRQATEAHPKSTHLHSQLADILKRQAKDAEWRVEMDTIISLCQEDLRSKPDASTHLFLAGIYQSCGRRDEARAQFRLGIGLSRSFVGLNSIAMQLATSLDAKDRDGDLAVECATKACELSGWIVPMCLDTLAAAYAEKGDFETAVKWQTKACELNGDDAMKQDLLSRVKLYKEKKPAREGKNIF
jgi:tetratricopeptide (TPR) repeat protein